jgi:hypothetical protein
LEEAVKVTYDLVLTNIISANKTANGNNHTESGTDKMASQMWIYTFLACSHRTYKYAFNNY